MKKKKVACSLLALLLTFNLVGCKEVEKEQVEEETKGYEDFIDLEEFKKFSDEIAASVNSKIDSVTKTIGEVTNGIVEDFNEKMDALEEKLTSSLDEKTGVLEERIDELEKEVDSLKEEQVQTETKKENIVEINNVAYINTDSVLYDSAGNEIGYIDAYQKVLRLISYENGMDLVEWFQEEGSTIGYVSTSNLTDLPSLFVEVDISSQTVNLVRDGSVEYTSSIVTGHPNTPTRIGYFDIDSRETNRYLSGPGYKVWVNYWMPFDGGIGLHDADGWRTQNEYGGETYISDGSHGCVNMPNEAAEYMYNNLKTGNMVLVHK